MSSSSNLDSFVKFSKSPPRPLFESTAIQDRDSTFVAYLFRITSPEEARAAVIQTRRVTHASNPASHEMHAYRTMSLRAGRDGLRGPEDFELKSASDDDGENYGGARILKVMEKEGVIDAVVICSRWLALVGTVVLGWLVIVNPLINRYGGTMLGPVRFTHIENCTRQVCQQFKTFETVEEIIPQLLELDDAIITLRAQLASLKDPTASQSETKSGAEIDIFLR